MNTFSQLFCFTTGTGILLLIAGQEEHRAKGFRTGGTQDRRDEGQEGCRTGGMQEWRDAGQVG